MRLSILLIFMYYMYFLDYFCYIWRNFSNDFMFCWLKDLWECILKVKKVFVEITYFKFLSYILFKYQNLFTYILEEFFWCNSINSLTQPFSATFLYFIEELLLSNIQGKKILKTRVKKSKVTQIHTYVSKYLSTFIRISF